MPQTVKKNEATTATKASRMDTLLAEVNKVLSGKAQSKKEKKDKKAKPYWSLASSPSHDNPYLPCNTAFRGFFVSFWPNSL